MNRSLVPVLCALIAFAAVWLGLLWCARFKPSRRRRTGKMLVGIAAVLLLFVPAGGLPLWNRAFSFYPNPSLPMLGIVCAALWQRLLGIAVFKPADWRATWIFGALAGTVLYLHPIVLGAVDLYYWGWERDTATWALAGAAAVFLAGGNRLGVLLLAALIGYAVNALESRNGWDYVMDPIYWVISVGVLVQWSLASVFRWSRASIIAPTRRRAASAIVPSRQPWEPKVRAGLGPAADILQPGPDCR
ncbi:MAG: hypothetical protein Q7S40_28025 [Opitutaceae bacterium]|nr:hypothetical protein [Opitutaceae bacterium]